MPTIPLIDPDLALPSQSRLPRAAPEVPNVPHPPGTLGASQLLGTAVTELGQRVQQAGTLEYERRALETRQQEADAVLAARLRGLETIPVLQTAYDEELNNPDADYTTFPERVLARGRQAIAAGGTGLTGRAAQLYTGSIQDNLNVLHQRALTHRREQRQLMTGYVWGQELQQARRAFRDAQTPFETIVARAQLEQAAQGLVETGRVAGPVMAERLQAFYEEEQVEAVKRATRVNPKQMLAHLALLLDNKPGIPGLPVPPQAFLAQLHDDADQEVRQAQAALHQGDIQAEKTAEKAQQRLEAALLNELDTVMQTPDPDPAAIQTIHRKIMAAGAAGTISEAGHVRLSGLARTFVAALTKVDQKIDEDRLAAQFDRRILGPTPTLSFPTLDEIQAAVGNGITAATGSRLMRDREAQLEKAHPSKIFEVQQAKTRLRESILQALGWRDWSGGTDAEVQKAAQMQRANEAEVLFDEGITVLQESVGSPQEKIAIARRHAMEIGREITRRYAPHFTGYTVEQLPPFPPEVEAIFQAEGLSAAASWFYLNPKTFPPEQEAAIDRGLKARERLGWLGGPKGVKPKTRAELPAPEDGWIKWLNDLFYDPFTSSPPATR